MGAWAIPFCHFPHLFLNNFDTVGIVSIEVTAIKEYDCQEAVYLVYNNV